MIYIVYPADPTTKFLLSIPKKIIEIYGDKTVQLIIVEPSDISYESALAKIEAIPSKAVVLFMGHGQEDKLWGAENEAFIKKPFVSKTQSKIFSGKFVFLLSCNSNQFLRGTFSFSKIINSIGFGSLPTEMTEVENSKRLLEQGVNENVIEMYKEALVELVAASFCDMLKKNYTFSQLSNTFMLRLNKKISQVILQDKTNSDNRILADLLFQMKSEMVFI